MSCCPADAFFRRGQEQDMSRVAQLRAAAAPAAGPPARRRRHWRAFRWVAASAFVALAAPTAGWTAKAVVVSGFDGVNQAQRAALSSYAGGASVNVAAAVGTTQVVEIVNGVFSVYDKATGASVMSKSDAAFFADGGIAVLGTLGSPRVLFDAAADRWVASAYGYDARNTNLAVSVGADATGPWKAIIIPTIDKPGPNADYRYAADYPTLAIDRNAVYIGTNDFFPTGFAGTTLQVIPIGDAFAASGPSVANETKIFAPANPGESGFYLQGVNNAAPSATGAVVADGVLSNGIAFAVNHPGGGASLGAVVTLADQAFLQNGDARQPDGSRNLDAGDTSLTSSVYQFNGKIYFTRTVTAPGSTFTETRVTVLDAATFAVVQQFDIKGGGYDYFQSAIAVDQFGAVVSYTRSGSDPATGALSLFANSYTLDADGLLVFDANHLIKLGDNPGFHEPVGGRRTTAWGGYVSATIDPSDPSRFWIASEYATHDAQGADAWGTWISEIGFDGAASGGETPGGAPEPASWLLIIGGFGLTGLALRRRRIAAAG
jgi:hypothetical protein